MFDNGILTLVGCAQIAEASKALPAAGPAEGAKHRCAQWLLRIRSGADASASRHLALHGDREYAEAVRIWRQLSDAAGQEHKAFTFRPASSLVDDNMNAGPVIRRSEVLEASPIAASCSVIGQMQHAIAQNS